MEDYPGLLVSVDLYKASDNFKAFEYFSFSEDTIKWISVIYNSIESWIITNGTHVRRVYSNKGGKTGAQ